MGCVQGRTAALSLHPQLHCCWPQWPCLGDDAHHCCLACPAGRFHHCSARCMPSVQLLRRGRARDRMQLCQQGFSELLYVGCPAGHSLGGALAMLAAFDLAPLFPWGSVEVHTIGAPRPGNAAFAKVRHRSQARSEAASCTATADVQLRVKAPPGSAAFAEMRHSPGPGSCM